MSQVDRRVPLYSHDNKSLANATWRWIATTCQWHPFR